jgi:hypothetical protein
LDFVSGLQILRRTAAGKIGMEDQSDSGGRTEVAIKQKLVETKQLRSGKGGCSPVGNMEDARRIVKRIACRPDGRPAGILGRTRRPQSRQSLDRAALRLGIAPLQFDLPFKAGDTA